MPLTGKRKRDEKKIIGNSLWSAVSGRFWDPCLPTVSNQWNTYRQSRLISNYEQAVSDMQPEDYTKEWEAAREFDSTLVQNNIYGDVFGSDDVDMKDTDYWKVLNVAGDGVMGYLSIPKINIKLAIYHGTAEDVLQTGIGHMNGTSLPIGGESTTVYLPLTEVFRQPDYLRI